MRIFRKYSKCSNFQYNLHIHNINDIILHIYHKISGKNVPGNHLRKVVKSNLTKKTLKKFQKKVGFGGALA